MTEHVLNIGNKVIATLRKPEALSDLTARYPPTQLLVVKVDVTNNADITAAFAKAEQVFGRIDVVFNNAGVGITGEVESTGEADAREMFDVNFWGAAHVSKEAVRFFRDVNKPAGGRLLQVSSRLGLVGGLANGFYSASYVWLHILVFSTIILIIDHDVLKTESLVSLRWSIVVQWETHATISSFRGSQ